MDISFDYKDPSIVIGIPEYKNGYKGILSKGAKIHCTAETAKDNIQYGKKLMGTIPKTILLNP